MKLKRTLGSLALAVALGGSAVASHATTIMVDDGVSQGTFSPFGGFDWSSLGTAVATGFNLTATGQSTSINLTYWADAARLTTPTQSTLTGPTLDILNGDIEYTILGNLTETATCTADNGAGLCTSASFILTSGNWSIWYDITPDAIQLAGTGFTDGVLILSGIFNPGFAGTFNATLTGGIGSNTVSGSVLFTNNTYINPSLLGTNAATTLQFGTDRTDGGGLITGSPNGPVACNRAGGTICLQADANQTFSVPEPSSLALFGLGLLGLAGIGRRRQKA